MMRDRDDRSGMARALGVGAVVSVAYLLAAWLGFRFAVVAEQVTTVWAPSGIGLAALLILGRRFWPAIYVGALLANAATDAPLWTAASIAAGNTLEAVVGAWALRRMPRFDRRLGRVRSVAAFGLTALMAPVLSATLGVATLCASGVQPWPRFGDLWRSWWLGDAIGVLLVAPVLLTIAGPWTRRRVVETAALAGAAVVATQLVFGQLLGRGDAHHPLEYVIFPFIIAAAMRGGQPMATLVVFAASVVTIVNTARGAGPFADSSVNDILVFLQVFMGVLAATALLLAAAMKERETGERRRAAAARVAEVLAEAPDVAAAAPAILQAVCRALEWQVGGLWLVDHGAGRLRCLDMWADARTPAAEFIATSRSLHFLRGQGLPGRVWEARHAAWIEDVVHDDNFPRASIALDARLRGAFGFPIALGDQFLGVIEFFSRTVEPPDPDLLQTMSTVGHQVGQFIGRKREETALAEAVREREHLLVREAVARREAEAANHAKDEFLATLSHELRTPLNAILGWTRILLDGNPEGQNARHALEVIDRNAHLQAQLVSDILDVSRIISGGMRVEMRPVDLGAIVVASLEAARPAADARRVRLRPQLSADAAMVAGDEKRLQQVIWNLISNAVKFSNTGGLVVIEVERRRDTICMSVSDDGIGIDPAFLPFVFDRFRQADGSAGRMHGGLGLGLAIVRHLVELHGGAVRAESAGIGRGSTFTVELPRVEASTDRSLSDALSATTAAVEPSAALSGIRALVVDDQEDARVVMTMMLTGAGARVVTAESTNDALATLDGAEFDVLLTDIGMPGPDGYALIREVRRRDEATGTHLPAAAVTAYASPQDRERALRAGFDLHITKPVELRALVAGVLSLCRGRGDAAGRMPAASSEAG
jgi:signal transduction histidine kinase/CheY-like chemotaxis protein